MIRSVLLAALLASAASAQAQTPDAAAPAVTTATASPDTSPDSSSAPPKQGTSEKPDRSPDRSIDAHRIPFEELNERMIGSTSQSVRFNWRKVTVGVGGTGSSLLELNNFGSNRIGVAVRRPMFGMMGELAITRVSTWSTPSSDLLSLTPYRQAGRPSRYELDFNLAFPLAEGVVTAWPGWFPATQLVFSATGGARYLFYPGSWEGMTLLEASTALIAPYLNDIELENLEGARNRGMAIDRARYSLLAGLQVDVYFHQGAYLSPRALIALPILSGFGNNAIGFWWELSFGLGWAF